jgi:hypothetical protein
MPNATVAASNLVDKVVSWAGLNQDELQSVVVSALVEKIVSSAEKASHDNKQPLCLTEEERDLILRFRRLTKAQKDNLIVFTMILAHESFLRKLMNKKGRKNFLAEIIEKHQTLKPVQAKQLPAMFDQTVSDLLCMTGYVCTELDGYNWP